MVERVGSELLSPGWLKTEEVRLESVPAPLLLLPWAGAGVVLGASPLREEEVEMIGDMGCGDSKLNGGRNGGPERLDEGE